MLIKIASYNLWFHKAYSEMSELARRQKPDVVCLQECFPTELQKTIHGLTLAGTHRYVHKLPLIHRSSKAPDGAALRGDMGMAIYYNPHRLELLDIAWLELPLPWQERRGGRIFQLATLKDLRNDETFAVANIHLSALLAPNRARRKQLQAMLAWITEQTAGIPVVLAGDFNYPLAQKRLRNLMEDEGFRECGTHLSLRTHTNKLVKGKFDRIFISTELQERAYDILPFGASDHAPVTATLALSATSLAE